MRLKTSSLRRLTTSTSERLKTPGASFFSQQKPNRSSLWYFVVFSHYCRYPKKKERETLPAFYFWEKE
jgi:hypothetical protein